MLYYYNINELLIIAQKIFVKIPHVLYHMSNQKKKKK